MKAGNLRVRGLILLILIAVLLCPIVYGKVIYVDDDAVGTNNGRSWENAYVYLQDALADANSAGKPVEIRVAQGVYKPNEGLVAMPEFDWRMSTFQLINGVSIKGGYAGLGQSDPNAHDVKLYETILSGDLNGDDINVVDPNDLLDELSWAENSYHVVTGSGTGTDAVLDGFTITGGQADDPREDERPKYDNLRCGGGIYNILGNPMIINCTFSNNRALYWGGGIYNEQSNPILINCILKGNRAERNGGGIYNFLSNPSLENCTFSRNWSESKGGGMYNSVSSPTLTNCIFTGNVGNGAGIHNYYNSSPMITNCIFSDNLAPSGGGGVYNGNHGRLMLINCRITGNEAGFSAVSYGRGGGIYNYKGSHITLINCVITGNKVVHPYGIGGGICNMSAEQSGSVTLRNCTIADNLAPDGNAIACDSQDQNLSSTITINNCILWNGGDEIWNNDNSIVTITYSNVQGLFQDRHGMPIGIINEDPCFAFPGFWERYELWFAFPGIWEVYELWVDGDYHLKSQAGRWNPNSESWVLDEVTSPCIDAGDPNSPVGDEPGPNGGRINMGAYGGTAEASKSPYVELLE